MSATVSEESAKICSDCLKGFVLEGDPKGTMNVLNGVNYYLAQPEKGAVEGKAIVLAYDIFGFKIANPKLLADKYAELTKLPVYVVDYLNGDYPDPSTLTMVEKPISDLPFLERFSLNAKSLLSFATKVGPLYLYRHRPGVTVPIVEQFITALRSEKAITRVGIVGFCLGGVVVVKLANSPVVDVVVAAHPGPLAESDIQNINKPIRFILAQEDLMFDHLKAATERILAAKTAATPSLPTSVLSYAGTNHGFAVRPNLTDPLIRVAFENATADTVAWFETHL